MPGDRLTLYEQLKRDESEMGKVLGLEKQFSARYTDPDSVYASPKSLMQVYLELSAAGR